MNPISTTGLPAGGYVREAALVGQATITVEQAEANKREGKKRGLRPRPGRIGILPFSSGTLWNKVKAGDFPAPVKLSERVTAWKVEDVASWMRERNAGTSTSSASGKNSKHGTPAA